MRAVAEAEHVRGADSRGSLSTVILCADDYAITGGVSRAIVELAAARRLSATSVLVDMPDWPTGAADLRAQRGHLATGLHLNLTLGTPLVAMPHVAPSGQFPRLGNLTARALLGALDAAELRAEIERQLDRFEQGLGFLPDHIDGHQHVHVLPSVRHALVDVVSKRYATNRPLIRVPTPLHRVLLGPGPAKSKAAMVGLLGFGFAEAVREAGLPANDTFAGFSNFDVARPYAQELHDALREPGRRHVVMCHPGHPDAELARIDPVVARRGMEYEALMREPDLPARIWHPSRRTDGPPIAWSEL